MCEPTTILAVANVAMGVGSAIVKKKGQDQAHAANKAAALESLKNQTRDLSVRQQQEQAAAMGQVQDVRVQSAEAQGLASASAAEAGVTGMSVALLLDDIQRDELGAVEEIEANAEMTFEQLQRMKEGAVSEAKGRINSVPKGSWLETGLEIGGHLLDYASSTMGRQPGGSARGKARAGRGTPSVSIGEPIAPARLPNMRVPTPPSPRIHIRRGGF